MNARRPLTLFAGLVWAGLGLGAQAQAAHVNVIELDNRIISPVTQQYIEEAVERSESDGAVCLVVKLDTGYNLGMAVEGTKIKKLKKEKKFLSFILCVDRIPVMSRVNFYFI